MAKKVTQFTMVVKTDAAGKVVSVRFVAGANDNSHLYGAADAKLTNGEKNALKAMANKIIADLEK